MTGNGKERRERTARCCGRGKKRGYSLIRVGVVVLGSEASHEIAIISSHHLLHVFEVMGWRRAFGSTQGGSIWRRSWMAGRRGRHAPRRRRIIVWRKPFCFNLKTPIDKLSIRFSTSSRYTLVLVKKKKKEKERLYHRS